MTPSPQQPDHTAKDAQPPYEGCNCIACKAAGGTEEDAIEQLMFEIYGWKDLDGNWRMNAMKFDKAAETKGKVRRLLAEARMRVVTELDNSADEVTPDVFDKFYMEEIARFKAAQGGKSDE